MWQYQSGGEADLDTSDAEGDLDLETEDEVLEDAPPLQQERNTRHQQPHPGPSGPKNQTWQAWEQQHHQPGYEEWAQSHGHILKESVENWSRVQRARLEEQRESLYSMLAATQRVERLLQQQEPKQKSRHPLAQPPLGPHQDQQTSEYWDSSLHRYRETSLPSYQTSLPSYQEQALPQGPPPPPPPPQQTSPPPQPQPQPPAPTNQPIAPLYPQPNLLPVTTHPQKILQLLLYTTALQQALQTTFTLITTHETHVALAEQRTPDLAPLSAFFHAIERTVTRTSERLDIFWRSAQRADANGGEFRLAGRAAQVEFCRAWEGVVQGYLEVRRLEGVVFGGSSFLRPAASGEGWAEYVRELEMFGEGVGAFGGRLV